MNLLENEDFALERFEKAVTGEDVATCYDMSLKEFEHSGIHDLFKVISFTSSYFCNMYINILLTLLITCASHVKVHSCIQAGHGDGQDEDPT